MKHVVMFSGGLGSWMTAKRVAEKYGTDDLVLLFADVGGQHDSPHAGEDADTYRFINEAAANVGGELVTLNEGRNIWEVFRDDRFLGNSRLANCSKYLKQIPCREWLDANCDPDDTTIYVGIDWSESHRLPAIVKAYLPYRAEAPMTEPPYLDKSAMQLECIKAGMAIPRLYAAGFPHNNCFTPDTRIITDRGVRSLDSLRGESFRVLGKGGGWKAATIESFGEQATLDLTLRRYADEKVVTTTADHFWPVRKSSGRTAARMLATSELRPGQAISGMYGTVRHNVVPSVVGIQAGFTFGDGSVPTRTTQNDPARAYFCGDKDKALLPYFSNCRTSQISERVIAALDLPRAWKAAPDLSESQSYLYGWLAGYFAADGTVAKGSARIASANIENLELVRDVAAILGIATNRIRTVSRLGYGSTKSDLHTVALVMGSLRDDFFLIAEHRKRFMHTSRIRPADWRVISVSPTGRTQEVLCAVVPDGHMFTLEDNVYTHNCGGGCVRAGQAQFELLLREHPDRYAYWEAQEQGLRDHLGKDVSILRDRTGGDATPMTLATFREGLERQPDLFDPLEFGGCGCFVTDEGDAA